MHEIDSMASQVKLGMQLASAVLSDDFAGDRHNMSGQAIQLK